MTEITYLNTTGEEETFSVELPEKLELRLDYWSFAIIWAALEESFYSEDPKDMYHYTEMVCEDFPLLSFILAVKYQLITVTEELDTIYDEIVTCYTPLVVQTETGHGYTLKHDIVAPPAAASDYVAPTVVIPAEDPVIAPVAPVESDIPNP
jgi:hypothetical protein